MDERYPIGKFKEPDFLTDELVTEWIQSISTYPQSLTEIAGSLNDEEQQLTYREGAWTIKQLVHHIADAQINVYTRIKLALTEDNPQIKPFEENSWATLADCSLPIITSLQIIEGLHARLAYLFEKLTKDQLERKYTHLETGVQTILSTLAFSTWHVNHHLAHIQNALATRTT
ncbi:YfiT family bacillithiol transferase [Ureibacillus sinduriensis]|uniref:Metal-dependent hydrolase n=1 Tax=Ureibacillus sinduriensis BLB-1 = JCM 15800 TaxID=1384057 RepID=A0A0A3IL93_9BACL|nr:putative metal-dependent hydrolase [Ureibacillus sinduriensis]KGR75602.1 metal-dependent hydrolase [Ureibacillus sinduriensis BLB-1 = JCM 15800]